MKNSKNQPNTIKNLCKLLYKTQYLTDENFSFIYRQKIWLYLLKNKQKKIKINI